MFAPAGTTILKPAEPDAVVALVDAQEVRREDVAAEIALLEAHAKKTLPPERLDQARSQMLEMGMEAAVTKAVVKAAMDNEAITVSEEEIDRAIEQVRAALPQGVTVEGYLERSETTMESFRERTAMELRFQKLREKVTSHIGEPDDEDLRQEYEDNAEHFTLPERVRARHILIAFQPDESAVIRAAKRERAEAVRNRLLQGEDFDKVAREVSEDPRTRENGGDLGYLARSRTEGGLQAAVFAQSLQSIGQVLESPAGFHIVQVLEHQPERLVSYDEARGKLSHDLLMRRRGNAFNKYLADLRTNATVTYPEKP